MRSLVAAVAVLGAVISISFWQAGRSDQEKFTTAIPFSPNVEERASITVNTDETKLVANRPEKRDKREASCDNPVVTFTEPVPIELRNQALIDADEAFKQFEKEHGVTATEEERQAYFKQVAEAIPLQMTTETVFDDQPDSPGLVTDQEANSTDAEFAKVKSRIKERGCGAKGHSGSAQLVSFSTVTYDNSVGWKSCTKTVSFSALNGLTVGKLRLVSEWYNTIYQVPIPSMIDGRATGTAYYVWSTDGEEDLRLARPYYAYPSGVYYAYQNRAWQDFVYKISVSVLGVGGSVTLDTHTLYAAHVFGPGGKCV